MAEENTSPQEESQENLEQEEEHSEDVVPAEGSEEEGSSFKNAAKEVIDQIEGNSEEESEEEEGESEEEEESKEEKKAKEEARKAWKLKVGGKEVEITDEEELIKRAQMGYSADEKWQEAAKMRKELESFVKVLQTNPTAALEQLGYNVDELAESHIQRRIEEMQKSPEEIEREKLQREIEELRQREKAREEELRAKEMEQVQEKYAMQIENEISDALDSSKTLPKSPYVVKRIADALLLAMNNGYHDVQVSDVLPVVESDIKSEIQDMFSAMPEEVVESIVGKNTLNKLRKRRVKKAKQAPKKPKVEPTGRAEINAAKEKQANKKPEKMSAKDFFKNIGSF